MWASSTATLPPWNRARRRPRQVSARIAVSRRGNRERRNAVAEGRQALDGDIRGWRIGYSRDFGYAPVDPEVRAIVDCAVQVFEPDLGCSVEEFVPGWQDPWNDFLVLCIANLHLAQLRATAERRVADSRRTSSTRCAIRGPPRTLPMRRPRAATICSGPCISSRNGGAARGRVSSRS